MTGSIGWFGPRTGVVVIAIVSLILIFTTGSDIYKSIFNNEERTIYHGIIIKCTSTNDTFLQDNKFTFIVPAVLTKYVELILTLFYIIFSILMINGVYFLKKIFFYPWIGLTGFFMIVHVGTVIVKFIFMFINSCKIPIDSLFVIISIWVLEIYLIGLVYNYTEKLNEQKKNTSTQRIINDSLNEISNIEISSYNNYGVAVSDPEYRHSVKLNPVRMISFDINNY